MPRATAAKKDKKARTKETRRAAGFVSLYANTAGTRTTPWDFLLMFGRVLEATKKTITVEELVEIYMSPQHMKSLAKLIGRQIEVYEHKYGPIPDIEEAAAADKGDQ
jgi:hypothetical protein